MQARQAFESGLFEPIVVIPIRAFPGRRQLNRVILQPGNIGREGLVYIFPAVPVRIPAQSPKTTTNSKRVAFAQTKTASLQQLEQSLPVKEKQMPVLAPTRASLFMIKPDQAVAVHPSVRDAKAKSAPGPKYSPALIQKSDRISDVFEYVVYMQKIYACRIKSAIGQLTLADIQSQLCACKPDAFMGPFDTGDIPARVAPDSLDKMAQAASDIQKKPASEP